MDNESKTNKTNKFMNIVKKVLKLFIHKNDTFTDI